MRTALTLAILLALSSPVAASPIYGRAPPAAASSDEARLAEGIRAAWKAAKRSPPALDPALSVAARDLAARIAAGGSLDEVARIEEVRLALARAGAVAADLAPAAARAGSAELAVESLRKRAAQEAAARSDVPARFGVGVVSKGGKVAAVQLQTQGSLELSPLPVQVPVGTSRTVEGKVPAPLQAAEVYVTPPGGKPVRLPAGTGGARFRSTIAFAAPGRYQVEVVGHGPKGPQVAAILDVYAGVPIPTSAAAAPKATEPDDIPGKEKAVARAVNGLRASKRLNAIPVDGRLSEVARGYAEELLRTGNFAHRSAVSGGLTDRLDAAGYAWQGAAENLGQAPTALGAQASLEASPGHLANLLDPRWKQAGYGVAVGTTRGGTPTVILVQVFAVPR